MPKITGTGSYAPRYIVGNDILKTTCDGVNPEWTRDTLGITERRYANNETVGEMATKAARIAIDDAGLHHSDIDMIIVATATPDKTGVSTAVNVQRNLGHVPDNCPALDINAVCSGFVYGLIMAGQFMQVYKHVLVIGADKFSAITDFSNRDCVFFGDAAGAVVLSQVDSNSLFVRTMGAQAGDGWALNGKTWAMDTKAVYKAAMKFLPEAIDKVLGYAGLTPDGIDHVIPHQASKHLLEAVAKETGLNFDKFLLTLDKYGNTAGASIPFTLDRHKDKIKSGDKILMPAIGAGWTWAVTVVEW